MNSELKTVVDSENGYKTSVINNKEWMLENLKVTRFNDKSEIPIITMGDKIWCNTKTGAISLHKDVKDSSKFGLLYNWYAVNDPRGIIPDGWRIPSSKEINDVCVFQASKGQEAFLISLLAGYRNGVTGVIDKTGVYGSWWTREEFDLDYASYARLYKNHDDIMGDLTNDLKTAGRSVVCVRDL